MMIKRLLLLCGLLCLPTALRAADLMQLYQLAQGHDARYQAALLKFKGDLLTLDISRSRYRPSLTLTHRMARNDYASDQLDVSRLDVADCIDLACVVNRVNRLNRDGTDSSYDSQQSALVLTQTLYDASLLADNQKARAFVEKARQEMLDAEQDLIMRTVAAYLRVMAAADEQRLIAAQIKRVAQLKELAEQRYRLGVGSEQDVAQAQAYHDAQSLALLAAESAIQLALHEMQQITGSKVETVAVLDYTMPLQVPGTQALAQWQQQARSSNNAIQAARALEQVSYFEMRAKKRAGMPKFNLAASYMDDSFSGGRGFSPESSLLAYGIEMKWPIYQGGGVSAAGKQAAWRLQESQQQVRALEEQIDLAVLRLLLQLETDIKRYDMALRALQSAETVLAVADKAYNNGAGTLRAWFEAEKNLAEARQQLGRIHYEHIEHRFSLLRVAGELSVDDIKALNERLLP